MKPTDPPSQPMVAGSAEPFVTKKQLCAHLGFRDVKSVSNLMRRRIIPWYDLGARVVRFKLSECEAALAKHKRHAAGQCPPA